MHIPVLLRLNVGPDTRSGVNLYGIGGPAIEIKIGEDLDSLVITEAEELDVRLVGGMGAELACFIVEVRGTWGLRNIARELSLGTSDVNSRTVAILAGFRLN